MGTRGDFRHHAAIGAVLGKLRADHIGEDPALRLGPAFHHRGGGLVAGCLDAENDELSIAMCSFAQSRSSFAGASLI